MFKLHEHFFKSINDILCSGRFIKKGKRDYISNIPAVFDIEASSFYKGEEKRACMYAWVFGINGKCIRGRTWEEFLLVCDKLVEYYELNEHKRFVIFIHNLGYEFQWFKKYFEWGKVFSIEPHKPIYAITTSGLEFRCSYLLSGYSLEKLGENLTKYKVAKMVGDLNYDLIRHSKTPLTDKEWGYILHDGLVVMAHIQEELERLGDMNKLPITKTGYVRQLVKEKCITDCVDGSYRRLIKNLTINKEDYDNLKKAFAGGFTHANSRYVGRTIELNDKIKSIGSFDLTSSYPTVCISEKFPMSDARPYVVKDYEDFIQKLNDYCCLFTINFHNIRPKVTFEHYISQSKCELLTNYILDNGRVVEAEDCKMTITEQDFFIIEQMYEWDYIDVGNFNIYYKDYLPKELINVILELYENKTSLKDIESKVVEYMVSKGMLNSVYGMMVTDPCKDDIIYDNESDWRVDKNNVDMLLYYYNHNNTRTLYYPWGVWVTAYARRNLFRMLLQCKDDYIYADTDSLKVINYEKYLPLFEEYNKNVEDKINSCLRHYKINIKRSKPKNIKGIEKPLGIWEMEFRLKTFKTLGAKRYIYEKENGELILTISGVSKHSGINYLKWKYKTTKNIFKHFEEDLEFPATYTVKEDGKEIVKKGCGKLTHTYIDSYMCDFVTDYLGVTGDYCEFSAVHLEDTSYNMSLAEDFKNYLLGVKASWII